MMSIKWKYLLLLLTAGILMSANAMAQSTFSVSIDANQSVVYPGYLSQLTINYGVTFLGGGSGNVSLSVTTDFCETGWQPTLSQSTFTTSGSGTFTTWIEEPGIYGVDSYFQCFRLTGTRGSEQHMVETDIDVTTN
jgi:hypothetical protein